MARSQMKLPSSLAEKLDRYVPRNTTICYNKELGWIYEQPDDDESESDSEQSDRSTCEEAQIVSQLTKLGPFGTCQTNVKLVLLGGSMNMYKVENRIRFRLLQEILGQHAPITPVTLKENARDVANIPRQATHFCWVYPPVALTQLSEEEKKQINTLLDNLNPEYTFLAFGGFAYFKLKDGIFHTIQTNSLVKSNNGLVFEGPFPWRPDYTENLSKQGRFQDVTIVDLLNIGIKQFCFINPNERLKSSRRFGFGWRPAPNGAFVYLYSSDLRPHRYDCYFTVTNRLTSDETSSKIQPFSLIRNQLRPTTATNRRQSASSNRDFERFTCSICLNEAVQCLFLPCKHMCTCATCAEELYLRQQSICPLCREEIEEVLDVFL